MSRRRATVSSSVVLSLVAIGGLAWSLFGWQQKANTSPDLLLPAKPVFLYTVDGLKDHQKAWEASASHKALVDSGLLKVVNKLIDFAVKESGEPAAELIQKGINRSFERGMSLAVSVESIAGVPAPQVTLLLHGSADIEAQATALLMEGPLKSLDLKQETIAGRKVTRVAIPDTPGYEVGWWNDGGHLVIVVGGNAVEAALNIAEGKLPNLSSNAAVKALRTSKDFEVASVSLIDLKALIGLVDKLDIPPIPGSGKDAGVRVADILKATGLDRLGTLQGRWGFRGEAIWSEATLQAPAPRVGLVSLLDQEPFTLADLPPVPKGCEHFGAFRFDVSKFNKTLIGLANQGIKAFAPEGTPTATEFIAQASNEIGFDPVEDLLEPLGDMIVVFVDPSASALMPAVGILVKVDDAEVLQTTLNHLEEKAGQLAGDANVKFRTKELNGRDIHVAQFAGPIAMFSPSWVIDKGWLVIGTTPQTVEAHIKRIDGKLAKWQPPAELAAGLKEMPQKFASFSYSDPRPGIRSLLSYASTGISFAELGMVEWRKQREQSGKEIDESAEFPITAEDVPVAEEVVASMFPNLNVTTVDEEGIHWYSRSSAPGLPIPGSGGGGVESVAVVAVLVALLLPAVQQAREAARRSQSKNNLKQLGLAMHNYHDTHTSFPAGTHPNAKLKVEERLSWLTDLLPYMDQAPLFNTINFEKAWNDKTNETGSKVTLQVLLNPSQPSPPVVNGFGVTNYVGMAGVGKDAPTLPITDNRVGVFGYDRVTRLRDIADGSSNTIMITDASKDFGPWSQGGKSNIRALTTKPYINGPDGIGSPHSGGLNVLLSDGAVRFVSQDIDPKVLEALVTIHGGETIGDF